MLDQIGENKFINTLIRNFSRSPMQLNGVHQSDSELIRLTTDSETTLAITTDTIAEEIDTGLYSDPYLIGWMTAMVNFSDLAAVGAKPVGLLTSLILPDDIQQDYLDQIQYGIRDACDACGTYLIGGDINTGNKLILTGCAVGTVNGGKVITRNGIRPNDLVYASGYLGSGNTFALTQLFQFQNKNFDYKPYARIKEGQLIRKWANVCMDTSDGLIATLDQLMRLNNMGFCMDSNLEDIMSSRSVEIFNEKYIDLCKTMRLHDYCLDEYCDK